eukprot:29071_5
MYHQKYTGNCSLLLDSHLFRRCRGFHEGKRGAYQLRENPSQVRAGTILEPKARSLNPARQDCPARLHTCTQRYRTCKALANEQQQPGKQRRPRTCRAPLGAEKAQRDCQQRT